MFHYSVLPFRNLFAVLFAIFTRNSITGTSVRTPTVVASAAGEVVPNKAIATATASSKKLDGRKKILLFFSRQIGEFYRRIKLELSVIHHV